MNSNITELSNSLSFLHFDHKEGDPSNFPLLSNIFTNHCVHLIIFIFSISKSQKGIGIESNKNSLNNDDPDSLIRLINENHEFKQSDPIKIHNAMEHKDNEEKKEIPFSFPINPGDYLIEEQKSIKSKNISVLSTVLLLSTRKCF